MPDGWEPSTEVERIYNLRDMMLGCRERAPKCFEIIDKLVAQSLNGELHPDTQLRLVDMMWNRGYGRPNQSLQLTINDRPQSDDFKRVQLYIPDNDRDRIFEHTIDGDVTGQEE